MAFFNARAKGTVYFRHTQPKNLAGLIRSSESNPIKKMLSVILCFAGLKLSNWLLNKLEPIKSG